MTIKHEWHITMHVLSYLDVICSDRGKSSEKIIEKYVKLPPQTPVSASRA